VLPVSVLEEVGALDPAAIEQVQAEAWPDVRDADELHDVLHTFVILPADSSQFPVLSSQEDLLFEMGSGSLVLTHYLEMRSIENR
jgi:hypothetical protein